MAHTQTVVLWDCNGKLQATLFCSSRSSFTFSNIDDQVGQIAVKVTNTASFDDKQDYLLRVVSKNGRLENQLLAGTLPRWAGGTLLAARCILASGSRE